MRDLLLTSLLGLIILLANSLPAEAKDMANRLGVGYKNQSAVNVPSLAVQYYPNKEFGFSLSLGVDSQSSSSSFNSTVKAYKIVFAEENLNFYMGAGAGIDSQQQSGSSTNSGFELSGFAGAEFFLPGLENLGFSFETGASIVSLSSGVRFRTTGDSPLTAGIIFYF